MNTSFTYMGENLYMASWNPTPEQAIYAFYKEYVDYDYYTRSSKTGRVVGHYTQVTFLIHSHLLFSAPLFFFYFKVHSHTITHTHISLLHYKFVYLFYLLVHPFCFPKNYFRWHGLRPSALGAGLHIALTQGLRTMLCASTSLVETTTTNTHT